MNLIMTMIFMKNTLKFQVLLQQSCLVSGVALSLEGFLGNKMDDMSCVAIPV